LVPIPTCADTSSIDSTDYDLFDDPGAKVTKHTDNEQEGLSENEISPLHIRRRRRKVPTSKFMELIGDELPHDGSPSLKRKGSVDGFLNRPLPDIPARKSSRQHLSRTSSTKSQAPSVTPSLLSCLDRELSPSELEIGVAKVVQVLGPISPPMPSLKSDSDQMDTSDLVETPVKNATFVETTIIMDSSLLPSIEEMSPMIQRNRPASPTGFSPQNPVTVIKRKPIAPAAPVQQQYMTAAPEVDMFSSPNVTLRKHRRSTFKKLPKSNTVANFSTQREEPLPSLPTRNSSTVSESQWMSRPTLPESASIHSGLIEYSHSNTTHSNNNTLKNAMNMFTTRSCSLGNSLKRNSTSWYRKARASVSSEETANSALLDNSSKASSMEVADN
jgi:hypothetical protein